MLLRADFGLAGLIKPGEVVKGVVGSPGYIAPEAINNQPHSLAMDVWSMGALLFVMLAGRHPHSKVDVNSLVSWCAVHQPVMNGHAGGGHVQGMYACMHACMHAALHRPEAPSMPLTSLISHAFPSLPRR